MSVSKERRARMELRRIGAARRKLDAAQKKLRKETVRTLRKHDGVLSRTEAAKLVGLSRSTTHGFYRAPD